MDLISVFLQLIVALGLLNVWLVRRSQKTDYRGCSSSSLKDEFIAYGLPLWSFYTIGFIKVSSALLLILGLWIPALVFPAAFIVSILMVGAVCMHVKVKDPLQKSLPALAMLLLSVALSIRSFYHLG